MASLSLGRSTRQLVVQHARRRARVPCVQVCAALGRDDTSNGDHSEPSSWLFRRSRGFFLRHIPRSLLLGAALSLSEITRSTGASHFASAANVDPKSPAAAVDSELPAVSAEQSSSSGTKCLAVSELQLVSGAFIIPHPAKAAKGGEDAYYISSSGRSFGIADGVGGWADVGIDPGEFSRMLMRECRRASESEVSLVGAEAPAKILGAAFQRSKHITGSSTACIVCLDDHKLHAANLGDSGFMVIRDGKIVFQSPSQQHSFNFPFQIGSYGDDISACEAFSVDVLPGDVIVAGSDGLLDNVYNNKSARVVWDAKQRGATPSAAAQQLATHAASLSKDPVYLSPFAKSAREHGFYYQGGKVDDITCIVSYIVPAAEAESARPVSKL